MFELLMSMVTLTIQAIFITATPVGLAMVAVGVIHPTGKD
tara:strand:- start:29 stop:148 length:120 start_codon:yes stop_codon:yes gene_type:complete